MKVDRQHDGQPSNPKDFDHGALQVVKAGRSSEYQVNFLASQELRSIFAPMMRKIDAKLHRSIANRQTESKPRNDETNRRTARRSRERMNDESLQSQC